MRIPKIRVVKQYMVKFEGDEIPYLKELMILHPYYQPREELWFTLEEINKLKDVLRPEDIDKAILGAPDDESVTS